MNGRIQRHLQRGVAFGVGSRGINDGQRTDLKHPRVRDSITTHKADVIKVAFDIGRQFRGQRPLFFRELNNGNLIRSASLSTAEQDGLGTVDVCALEAEIHRAARLATEW